MFFQIDVLHFTPIFYEMSILCLAIKYQKLYLQIMIIQKFENLKFVKKCAAFSLDIFENFFSFLTQRKL